VLKYIDEFRQRDYAVKLIQKIKSINIGFIPVFMEVCGTHTVSIVKSGIRRALEGHVKLVSGPGCPVCVTSSAAVDKFIALSYKPDVILTTFGEMMKVPGSTTSLIKRKAEGASVKVVHSPMAAFELAISSPSKKVVFLGVGFETTVPSIAATILKAYEMKVKNFYIACEHKLVPPALVALLMDKEVKLNGFICPGHVSVIIGANAYLPVAYNYGVPCVVSGFEPVDILMSIVMLMNQLKEKKAEVEIQYKRTVSCSGNKKALDIMYEVFEVDDSYWRGIGVIEGSGLKLREKYKAFDAYTEFEIEDPEPLKSSCICGNILKGINVPVDCPLFGKKCTPLHPVGPCMVSSEGSCAAFYKYGDSFVHMYEV